MFHIRNENVSLGMGVTAYGELVHEPTATVNRRFTVHYAVRPSADEVVRGQWSDKLHVCINPPAVGDVSPAEAAVLASLILAAAARAEELAVSMREHRMLAMAESAATA